MKEGQRIRVLHKEEQFTIDVEPQKNRIYACIYEECEERSDSSRLLEELHELKHHLTRGFTMLIDARQADRGLQWGEISHDVLDLLFEGGISKIAEIRSDASLSSLAETWRSEQIMPGVHLQRSPTPEEAEVWLDA